MRFKVAAALGTAALCAAVVSCSSGPVATAGTQAPAITVLTKGADNGNGDIFLAPQGGGQYGTGPEIVSITGKVLWFHRLPAGTFATDFRAQTYLGKPVLTWFQGGSNGRRGCYLQRPLPADRDRQAGERISARLPRVPDHAVEHCADPR